MSSILFSSSRLPFPILVKQKRLIPLDLRYINLFVSLPLHGKIPFLSTSEGIKSCSDLDNLLTILSGKMFTAAPLSTKTMDTAFPSM